MAEKSEGETVEPGVKLKQVRDAGKKMLDQYGGSDKIAKYYFEESLKKHKKYEAGGNI